LSHNKILLILFLALTSLGYEKVCVLFNIAALQSSIAASQSLDNDDGLKLATKLFQQSAGILNYLKSAAPAAISQEPTPDLNPETLTVLSNLMIAQAQETFIVKAIRGLFGIFFCLFFSFFFNLAKLQIA